MKIIKKILWILLGLAIIGLVLYKLSDNKKTAEEKVYHYDREKPISVETAVVGLTDLDEENTYTGTFEPNKEVKISSESQGKINTVLVDVGSTVRQGQTLIQLDNSLLKLQLESVEVQIRGLQDDVNRFTILAEADAIQGVQLDKAVLGLQSAKVQKSTILEQIKKTTVKAPFSGVVTQKLSEAGAFAAPGVPLLQIADISTLKFTVNVPESDLKLFNSGQNYPISADAFPEIPLNGKHTMTGSQANPGNSFPIQFQVKNTPKSDIKSGMFGKVELSVSEKEQGLLIPSSAIINEEDKAQIYLVKDGKAVLQTITTGKSIGSQTLVSDGLNPGDIIVTKGFINLFDGANISIKN